MGKMTKRSKVFYILYITVLFVFFYLPIVVTMIFSFNDSKSLTNWTGFSFRWYGQLINDGSVMKAVLVSVTIAIFATIISTVLGTITAIGLSKCRRFVRETVLNINNIPIMNPDIVTAIGLMLLFISIKVQPSMVTLILSHISFCIPYVILTVMPKLRQLDDNVAEAALDLGATPWKALTKVIIPQIMPAILSGALIAFSMSLDDFVVSYFNAGVGINTISMFVYSMKRYNLSVNAMSTLIVVTVTLVLVLVNLIPWIKDRKAQKEET